MYSLLIKIFLLTFTTYVSVLPAQFFDLPQDQWTRSHFLQTIPNELNYDQELESVVLGLSMSHSARSLLDEALEGGAISIQLGTREESLIASIWRNATKRTIILDRAESQEQQLGTLLYQLALLTQQKTTIRDLKRDLRLGRLTSEEYIERVLYIEYMASLKMYRIAAQGIRDEDWPEGVLLAMEKFFWEGYETSWEEYLEEQISSYSARWYQQDWLYNYKRRYLEAQAE